MAVGDIEQLVEGLVNRGLVSPKMVGRTVGQATLSELSNLGKSITESQLNLERERLQRLDQLKQETAKNYNVYQIGAQKAQVDILNKQIADAQQKQRMASLRQLQLATQPQILGQTDRTYTLAIPRGQGKYGVQSIGKQSEQIKELAKLLPKSRGLTLENIPKSNIEFMWGSNKTTSLEDLIGQIMGASTTAPQLQSLQDYYKNLFYTGE